MKTLAAATVLLLAVRAASAQTPASPPPTLKSVLLAQLKSTHDVQDWFVPAKPAIDGLTADQATWKDGSVNHSIAQLVSHLIFWDQTHLAKWKGETPPSYSGKNDDTFVPISDQSSWDAAVKRLDAVMTGMEKAVEAADDKTVQSWSSEIQHISAHNAYHIGQILYIRKQQGSWDPAKGVK